MHPRRETVEEVKLEDWISSRLGSERRRRDDKSREKFRRRLIVTACWKLIGDEETTRLEAESAGVDAVRGGTE